jgi:hypothetical protein
MDIKDIVKIISKIISALATILAGGWVYYRFVKGCVFKPRLTLIASARCLRIQGTERGVRIKDTVGDDMITNWNISYFIVMKANQNEY